MTARADTVSQQLATTNLSTTGSTFTPWVALIPSVGADLLLTSVSALCADYGTAGDAARDRNVFVDVGVGVAGAETAVASVVLKAEVPPSFLGLFIREGVNLSIPQRVSAGRRLSVRLQCPPLTALTGFSITVGYVPTSAIEGL
ncbi:hypothetical protein [Kineosporia succinea]|uniref:Uncharacterized protein n=1 Tax=Kineosporia succinea TaxID=84632 RepID=A0ABT9PB79_9ACTN|nr:hypothetical protein [Kineosporia succinea]MDP9829440.1 hypothetical protein [Kineosporia succinea]